MKTRGLVLLTIATLVIGLGIGIWFQRGVRRPYKTLPGTYECTDFGLPDPSYNRLRIDGAFKLFGIAKNSEFAAGQLSPKNESAANLELSMEVVHSPGFKLDPFTTIVIEGRGAGIEVNGRGPDGNFTVACRRWN